MVGAIGAGRAGQGRAGPCQAEQAPGGGEGGPGGPGASGPGRNGVLDLAGRVVPEIMMAGLYRLVQAGWGGVGAGQVGQGGACWRSIGYGPERVHHGPSGRSCCESTYKWLLGGVSAVGVVT